MQRDYLRNKLKIKPKKKKPLMSEKSRERYLVFKEEIRDKLHQSEDYIFGQDTLYPKTKEKQG